MSWLSEALSGGSNSSDEITRLQEEQAAEARRKDAERQARLDQGLLTIKQAFEGKPELAARTYDWKNFDPSKATSGSAVPGMAGFKLFNMPAVAATPGTPASYGPEKRIRHGGGDNTWYTTEPGGLLTPAGAGTPGQDAGWYVKGPDGKLYKQGETVSGQVVTGKTSGGFGNDFYDQFRQGIVDYYMPQVSSQYGDARKDLTYALADAGTLRSSVAAEEQAKLAEQNTLNRGDVIAQADTGAADLRSRVASERAKAESQLYATENPEVATAQALAAVRNISLDKPNLSPLGEIFKVAAVGGANALQGFRNQSTINSLPPEYRRPGTTVVGR